VSTKRPVRPGTCIFCFCDARGCASAGLVRMGQDVAHEVDAAALPCGAKHPSDSGLNALIGIGDHQLHASEASAGQLAQELDTDRLASEVSISMPSTSRWPSALTPTAMVAATETMRPPRRIRKMVSNSTRENRRRLRHVCALYPYGPHQSKVQVSSGLATDKPVSTGVRRFCPE